MVNSSYKIQESIGGREEQQDFSGSATTKFGLLVVICDGMGGTNGGATASKMAVNIIIKEVNNTQYNSAATALLNAIKTANSEIFQRGKNDDSYRGMGTTVVAIILQKEKATVAHVGDSRFYHLRQGHFLNNDLNVVFKTFDHSKVFELVRRGIMNEEQARLSEDSNVILRALGIKAEVEVEIKDNIPYLKSDRFLLCTDGIWAVLPEKKLLNLLNTKTDVQATLNNLVTTIDQIGIKSGKEHDNLTAAIIECNYNSTLKTPIDMQSKIIIISLSILLIVSLSYNAFTLFSGKPGLSKHQQQNADSTKSNSSDNNNNSESDLRTIVICLDSINKKVDSIYKKLDEPIHSAPKNKNQGLSTHQN